MSSKSDVAISVRGLSKMYQIAHQSARHTTVAEALVTRLKNPVQKVAPEEFWALRDVSFEVNRGDVLGVIGRNGAGKSTLLKVLSRITEPTRGEAIMRGRVGSLLEVGTGFHPELTGRENIFLNGAILGMTRAEITRQFEAIVDFSGTEKFLDTPVKRYSSGMYVRLAFAVAAHLNPEILIVDEVLAVGDAEFQKKCIGKMQDVAREDGRTILFVSHNMPAMRRLCNKAILMKSGTVFAAGTSEEIANTYVNSQSQIHDQASLLEVIANLPSDTMFQLAAVNLTQNGHPIGLVDSNFALNVEIVYEVLQQCTGFRVAIDLVDGEGTILFRSFHDEHADDIDVTSAGTYTTTATFPAHTFGPSQYELRIHAGIHNIRWCTPEGGVPIPLQIIEGGRYNRVYVSDRFWGLIGYPVAWKHTQISTKHSGKATVEEIIP